MQWQAIVAVATAYLLGSIDFGVVIPRLAGVDIYSVGSGNPGASNVLRTMGRGWAAAVLAGDVGKGFVAAMIADLWVGEAAGFAAAVAAVMGHCFPLFHRFRGGKGVATAGGAMLWLEPLLGLGGLVVWSGLVAVTHVASIASLTIAALLVPGAALMGHRDWSLVWLGAAMLVIVGRHRGNIQRLLRGAEHKVET